MPNVTTFSVPTTTRCSNVSGSTTSTSSTGALADILQRAGADGAGFEAFLQGEGRTALKAVQDEAEAKGVFGVPSFLLPDGDLYWGREHLPRLREMLAVA
jgi:2-hydroxychromene-2-carboxylate isomerase